jgi:very-short-patch-repair endonuclease
VGISSHFPVNQFLNVSFLNLVLDLIICLPDMTFFLYFAKERKQKGEFPKRSFMNPYYNYIQQIKTTARDLRQRQTPSEALLWDLLRDRRLAGRKFLRQHPIRFGYYGEMRFFIVDFYCAREKLVIELDGLVHEQQQDYDLLRTWIINQLGMKVIRFRNEELENPEEVLAKIEKEFG